jgi:hypothetical protein
VVTIDAGGCHKDVAELIRSKNAYYLLGLKGNQGTLFAEVVQFFDQVLLMTEAFRRGNDYIEVSSCNCPVKIMLLRNLNLLRMFSFSIL